MQELASSHVCALRLGLLSLVVAAGMEVTGRIVTWDQVHQSLQGGSVSSFILSTSRTLPLRRQCMVDSKPLQWDSTLAPRPASLLRSHINVRILGMSMQVLASAMTTFDSNAFASNVARAIGLGFDPGCYAQGKSSQMSGRERSKEEDRV
eukprot:760001-Hanusia_phi.AAC.3